MPAIIQGGAFFPIGAFNNVAPADVTIAFNQLIQEINGLFASLGASGSGFATMRQLRLAMSANSILTTYNLLVAADPSVAQNINWNMANTISVNDALYLDIQAKLGLTVLQMTALLTLAQTFEP